MFVTFISLVFVLVVVTALLTAISAGLPAVKRPYVVTVGGFRTTVLACSVSEAIDLAVEQLRA